jgi:hypothetical protein
MAGRKPIYDTESLEIGQKLKLPYRLKKFKDQYLYNFRERNREKNFEIIEEGSKLFVERTA